MTTAEDAGKTVIPYSLRPMAIADRPVDVYASVLTQNKRGGFTFCASVLGNPATVELQVPGKHNVANALAALAVAQLLGLPLHEAAQALGKFTGTGRRFEVRGEVAGVTVIDDYAHHPTEIKATLAAARSRYPGRRVWAVWQPHTYSRTRSLMDDFINSFEDADEVIVTEIYAAREPKQDFSSRSAGGTDAETGAFLCRPERSKPLSGFIPQARRRDGGPLRRGRRSGQQRSAGPTERGFQ